MTANKLAVSVGQYSDTGRKKINQDFHGVTIEEEPLLTTKGIAIALADGISSSAVGQVASQATITGFLQDYFCTSEAWSVKKSAHQVLSATNSWLYSQTQQGQYRFDKDRGYVCTLSAMILKSNTAHIFHLGDTRIYRLRGKNLEQLTKDHRLWVSDDKSYLSRAMGMHERLELDYKTLSVEKEDVFILTTDGIYEFVAADFIVNTVYEHADDLDCAAKLIVEHAYAEQSDDNLTIQIVKILDLPEHQLEEVQQKISDLPLPPLLEARMEFDGYLILRNIYISSRSHVYLAKDLYSQQQVVIKTPSTELRTNKQYLESFLMEDWITKRIDNPHVLTAINTPRKHKYLYNVTEFIEGKSLSQWIVDNPKPQIDQVRSIINQVAKGLQAFHRLEMVHQDLRPNNIMIDASGTVKIIDFGATQVGGLLDIRQNRELNEIKGTAQFTAPEYYLGEGGSTRSDIFSLGVITYHMLTGILPYGTGVSKIRSANDQRKLVYQSILEEQHHCPPWVDYAIKKAVNIDPLKRYSEVSEFAYDLNTPNSTFLKRTKPPLIERDPLIFWQSISLILLLIVIIQSALR